MTSASAQCTTRTQCPLTLRCFNLSCAGFATRCVYTKKWDSPFHLWAFAEDRNVQKNGRTHFIQECFQISLCWPRHTVFVHEKMGLPISLLDVSYSQVSPVKGAYLPKSPGHICYVQNLWEAAFPKSFSKCTSEHPAVYRGAISECSSFFGSLQEGNRYPRPEVGNSTTEIQSRYPSARLFRQKTS